MGSAGKSQLLSFMDELIPTIRTALCDRFCVSLCLLMQNFKILLLFSRVHLTFLSADSTPEVRESAGLAFSTLYKVLFSDSLYQFDCLIFKSFYLKIIIKIS